jgi:thiamine-monophosphate kinase
MPSEFTLIARHFSRPVQHSLLGAGDDGAIVQPSPGMELVVTTDMLVAGIHFLADVEPAALGWKTLAVNVSDLAAMGAQPRWALLSAALPGGHAADDVWLAAFASGFYACASRFGIDLIGGDTTRATGDALTFSVTLLGEAPPGRSLLRSGARPGDEIWVSGTPGLAALGLAHQQGRCTLQGTVRTACLHALEQPQPRVALGLALARASLATAAIDVSDGLLADLGHILDRSGMAATLHFHQLPAAALTCGTDTQLATNCLLAGGDDYELIFCAPPANHNEISILAKSLDVALSCIGHIEAGPAGQLKLLDAQGHEMKPARRGFDHFA